MPLQFIMNKGKKVIIMKKNTFKKGICLLLLCSLLVGCENRISKQDVTKDQAKEQNDNIIAESGGRNDMADYMPEIWEPPMIDSQEEYGEIREKGFTSTKKQPTSTFSADVDTASYSNLRRMIESGYSLRDINADAVRIEEMINYFSYDYKGPRKKEPFGVNVEIAPCPWNEDSELMMLGLQTQEVEISSISSNFVFLLDVSGSMYDEDKLPLLQEAFTILTDNLSENDRVSIVTYAGSDHVALYGATGDEKEKIKDVLYSLEAGGSTAGSKGIITAYEIAEEFFLEDGNNRVILATDGDLNVGLTSVDELEELIDQKKETGVYLSVLGFGTGNLKDNKMEVLADKGNGNYSYIDGLSEAKKVLQEELGATMITVAKDVKLQVEFNQEMVKEYRLIGYENRVLANKDFDNDKKDAGEIGAGHSVTALYEVQLTKKAKRDSDNWADLNIRYKEPDEDESRLLTYDISKKAYTKNPSDDFIFVSAVAEFGMILRDSDYKADASLQQVLSLIKETDFENDIYKDEFYYLVKQIKRAE